MIAIDSSFLVAVYNLRDVHHALAARTALRLQAGEWGPGLVLDYVFTETMNVLHRKAGLAVAAAAGRSMLVADDLSLSSGAAWLLGAFDAFARQDGMPSLSLVDFAVAHCAIERTSGKLLTFDHGFRAQADVQVLPA